MACRSGMGLNTAKTIWGKIGRVAAAALTQTKFIGRTFDDAEDLVKLPMLQQRCTRSGTGLY